MKQAPIIQRFRHLAKHPILGGVIFRNAILLPFKQTCAGKSAGNPKQVSF
jgi:hypothetical protein